MTHTHYWIIPSPKKRQKGVAVARCRDCKEKKDFVTGEDSFGGAHQRCPGCKKTRLRTNKFYGKTNGKLNRYCRDCEEG